MQILHLADQAIVEQPELPRLHQLLLKTMIFTSMILPSNLSITIQEWCKDSSGPIEHSGLGSCGAAVVFSGLVEDPFTTNNCATELADHAHSRIVQIQLALAGVYKACHRKHI